MIPVADLFNYHPVMAATQMCFAVDSAAEAAPAAGAAAGAAGEVASSSSASSSGGARAGPSFRYYALRDLAPGEEVFVSYGKLSDAQLLHTYGFVVEAPTPGSAHVRAAFQPLDFEAAGTSASAGDGGGTVAALLRPLSFARQNPYDTVQLPFANVRAAAVGVLGALGASGPRQTKLLLRATQLLRDGHVIPEGGFTLQLQDASLEGVRALEGLWGCEHPGQLLGRLLPPELLTALQVLLMPAEALAQYTAVAQEVAPSPLLLPLESPSALIAKLAALKARAGARASCAGASGAAGSVAATSGGSSAGAGGAGASGAGGKRGRPTGSSAAGGSGSAAASKRPRVEPQSDDDDENGGGDGSSDASDGSEDSDDEEEEEEEETAADVRDALSESAGVWTALLHAVTSALAKYPSTLKEDRAWYERLQPAAGAAAAPSSSAASSASASAESLPVDSGVSSSAGAGAVGFSAGDKPATAAGEAAQADVERGRSDYLYRCSRLLCMREKEVLELVRGALLSELSTLARHDAAGSDDDSDDDASDEEAD